MEERNATWPRWWRVLAWGMVMAIGCFWAGSGLCEEGYSPEAAYQSEDDASEAAWTEEQAFMETDLDAPEAAAVDDSWEEPGESLPRAEAPMAGADEMYDSDPYAEPEEYEVDTSWADPVIGGEPYESPMEPTDPAAEEYGQEPAPLQEEWDQPPLEGEIETVE